MNRTTRILLCAVLGAHLSPALADTDTVAKNVEKMADAARQLEFSDAGNMAFLLVKQEAIVAPVAIIFGYADNASACEALAKTLSTSGRDGTFKCQAVY